MFMCNTNEKLLPKFVLDLEIFKILSLFPFCEVKYENIRLKHNVDLLGANSS